MIRYWDCSGWFGWLAYESARMRGERVAFGVMWAYFVAESGHFDGKRANKGSMIFGGSRDDP